MSMNERKDFIWNLLMEIMRGIGEFSPILSKSVCLCVEGEFWGENIEMLESNCAIINQCCQSGFSQKNPFAACYSNSADKGTSFEL